MKLVDLVPINEGSMQARELADRNSLQQLQAMYDQLMRDMEQEAEPEGGPIADMYGQQMQDIEDAMQMKRGKTKDVPYDVAIGRMTQDEYDRAIGLKEGMPTSISDEDLDELLNIILKYVKDPDDAQAELDRFDQGGFDAMSNMVIANLLRDPEYKKWYNNLHSIKESNDVRKVIRKIIKEQNFDDRLRSMMGADDFEKATNPKLAKLINNAIMTVDPNMSYVDFAKGVAQVLIDEYGTHNYEPFIKELKKALDSTLG